MKKFVLMLIIIVFLPIYADWHKDSQDLFMRDCILEGGKYSFCKCSLDFLQMRRKNVGLVTLQDIKDAIQKCKELQ